MADPRTAKFRPYLSGAKPTYASVLLAGLLQRYGPDFLSWDPSTIEIEVKQDYEVDLPRVVFDQIMSMVTAITTTAVYQDVEVFDQFVNAINRAGAQHQQEPPTVEELAWAVTELMVIDPEPVGLPKQPFSRQIQAYCRVCLKDDGVMAAPDVLGFANYRQNDDTWADDPEMFHAVYTSHEASAREIEALCRQKLNELLDQLEDIGIELKPDSLNRLAEPEK